MNVNIVLSTFDCYKENPYGGFMVGYGKGE